jgi:flagellin-specific chaperone FliS
MMYAKAYQQQSAGFARIDLVLEIYDRLLNRLRRAQSVLMSDPAEAKRLLDACAISVAAMANGLEQGQAEVNDNLLRLYEFVVHSLRGGSAREIGDAIDVLNTLREGFEQARPQALDMERQGAIPPLASAQLAVRA